MLLIKKKKKGDLGGRLKAQRRKLNAKGYRKSFYFFVYFMLLLASLPTGVFLVG
jgi:hypothetical protein